MREVTKTWKKTDISVSNFGQQQTRGRGKSAVCVWKVGSVKACFWRGWITSFVTFLGLMPSHSHFESSLGSTLYRQRSPIVRFEFVQ